MTDSNSSRNTDQLVEQWVRATQEVARYEKHLKTANENLEDCIKALGNHLAPEDMKFGEVIGVWVNGEKIGMRGDVMIEVRKLANLPQSPTYALGIRKRSSPVHLGDPAKATQKRFWTDPTAHTLECAFVKAPGSPSVEVCDCGVYDWCAQQRLTSLVVERDNHPLIYFTVKETGPGLFTKFAKPVPEL